jgi:peptidoglycan/xylan/chitin deacetylase (PgdA/CDA1 family)
MALSMNQAASANGTAIEGAPRAANDAFSFWKLPEQWRSAVSEDIEVSREIAEHFLFERYLSNDGRRPPSALKAYYRVKKLIPERVRHAINSAAIRARNRMEFPHWPCESALTDFWRDWLRNAMEAMQISDGWHIGFWPRGAACCVVLTHDVESPLGFGRMRQMADLEEKYGFRSAWNLPLAQYPIDWQVVEELRARGFEFGAHGLSHDGRLFRSYQDFSELAPAIERISREHGLRGFRAPSTLRRAEWIASMDFEYDGSFSDTDPYEPQPGGTCSVFPFHLAQMIELPYTLPQDHTLIHLLHRNLLPTWATKAQWIASLGGLILLLVHPDYSGSEPYLSEYEEMLKRLAAMESAWRALPGEAASWWRRRSQMELHVVGDRPVISGPDTCGAAAIRLGAEPLARG